VAAFAFFMPGPEQYRVAGGSLRADMPRRIVVDADASTMRDDTFTPRTFMHAILTVCLL
jgi:hypothetical protein